MKIMLSGITNRDDYEHGVPNGDGNPMAMGIRLQLGNGNGKA